MSAPVIPRGATRERAPVDAPALDDASPDTDAAPPRSKWRRRLGLALALIVAATLAAMPWWVPPALSRLAFFHVRRIEIDGARYTPASDVLARLRVDTTWSVWTDLAALRRRVESHPLVASARVQRRLPGTLRVTITERMPIALAPTRDGVAVLGVDGRALPIDPSRVGGVDVPVVSSADPAMLRALAELRAESPALFARVSEVRRVSDEMRFAVTPTVRSTPGQTPFFVRTSTDVTPQRLSDMLPVEGDLARRRVLVTEIDLRFRDQVIARLP
jgi:cell division protein FtsQ